MKRATLLAFAGGTILFVLLLHHYGFAQLAAAVGVAGWGLLWVSLYRFVTLAADTAGWRVLFPGPLRPATGSLFRLRWIAEAINSLLPVAQVGGDVERARLAARLGQSGAEAGATVVVDFTLGVITQLLYTLLGVWLFIRGGAAEGDARGWLLGLLVAALGIAGFYVVQRLSVFRKMAGILRALVGGSIGESLAGDASELDRKVAALYGQGGRLLMSAGWRMLAWLLHTGETWLALYFLGAPVSFAQALVLESLSNAVRSAAFVIPGGLGVQEGGFVLLGARLGLTPEISLALALVKRVRELLVGGPGLIMWTTMEGRSLARWLQPKAPRGAKNDRT